MRDLNAQGFFRHCSLAIAVLIGADDRTKAGFRNRVRNFFFLGGIVN